MFLYRLHFCVRWFYLFRSRGQLIDYCRADIRTLQSWPYCWNLHYFILSYIQGPCSECYVFYILSEPTCPPSNDLWYKSSILFISSFSLNRAFNLNTNVFKIKFSWAPKMYRFFNICRNESLNCLSVMPSGGCLKENNKRFPLTVYWVK